MPDPSRTRASILAAASTLLASGCFPGPPLREAAHDPVPENGAVVIFVQDEHRALRMSIFDEEGKVLGVLNGQGWLAVERPPGSQVFAAADGAPACSAILGAGGCEHGSTDVGVIFTDLAPGRVYLVRLRFSSSAGFFWPRGVNRSCYVMDDSGGARFVDLVGVRPGGQEWLRSTKVMREGVAYATAPRGMEHPHVDGAAIVAAGVARFDGHCVDRNDSRLEARHGSRDWPVDPR